MSHFRTDAPLMGETTTTTKRDEVPTMTLQEQRDRAQARIDWDTAKAAERPKNNRDARQDMIASQFNGGRAAESSKSARDQMIDRMRGDRS